MKAPTEKPTVRKIASLPRDLAERIERFGTDRGMSESAAIRSLLEIALKHLDTQNDLFPALQYADLIGEKRLHQYRGRKHNLERRRLHLPILPKNHQCWHRPTSNTKRNS